MVLLQAGLCRGAWWVLLLLGLPWPGRLRRPLRQRLLQALVRRRWGARGAVPARVLPPLDDGRLREQPSASARERHGHLPSWLPRRSRHVHMQQHVGNAHLRCGALAQPARREAPAAGRPGAAGAAQPLPPAGGVASRLRPAAGRGVPPAVPDRGVWRCTSGGAMAPRRRAAGAASGAPARAASGSPVPCSSHAQAPQARLSRASHAHKPAGPGMRAGWQLP